MSPRHLIPKPEPIPSFWSASIKLGKTTELEYYKHILPRTFKKELISEFVEKLRKYLGCETCTSSVKPNTCKSCCGLYPIIDEYEVILK